MRKLSREVLFKLVFSKKFGLQDDDNQFDEILDVIKSDSNVKDEDLDLDYIKNVYQGVVKNFEEYKQRISQKVTKYKASRIYNADLIIISIALYEIEVLNIEPKIVISEAIKLAKKYSTEQSVKFINGVLAAFVKVENE